MHVEQTSVSALTGWTPCHPAQLETDADLVLIFGSNDMLKEKAYLPEIRGAFPRATILGCSTAGEIHNGQVSDDSITVTAVRFQHSRVRGAQTTIDSPQDSYRAGQELAARLPKDQLVHVLVLSDGLNINGSDLVRGLAEHLPEGVSITGGLAGDGARFQETVVVWGGVARAKSVAAVGLYGSRLRLGCASLGGWDPFGPERLITRSEANILYELDRKPALDLYKTYLGEQAAGLPATGLLFPLSLRMDASDEPVVRTILAVDEAANSLTFAGDVPEGALARLMKANFDRLIDGAIGAASACHEAIGHSSPELALLISCVGRKMILKQRIEEEVEGVRDVLGADTKLAGFYSYGEISPFTVSAKCELHNQTMTITTLSER